MSTEGRKTRDTKIPKKASIHHLMGVAGIRSAPARCRKMRRRCAGRSAAEVPAVYVEEGCAHASVPRRRATSRGCSRAPEEAHPRTTVYGCRTQRCLHTAAPRASPVTAHTPHALAPSCPSLTFLYFATRCHFQFFTFALFSTLWFCF